MLDVAIREKERRSGKREMGLLFQFQSRQKKKKEIGTELPFPKRVVFSPPPPHGGEND